MKNRIGAVFFIAACGLPSMLPTCAGQTHSIALVPQPLRMERGAGEFALNKDTAILVAKDSADAANVGKQLAERIGRGAGLKLAVKPSDKKTAVANAVLLAIDESNDALGAEGYRLDAAADGVVITAAAGPGLFYGMQTLLQLLPPQVFSPVKVKEDATWAVPAVHIEDRPRFPWRGLLLDVARHFFNKAEMKNFIDLMAQHKLNTLHWHLTDNQGWRIQITQYPQLTKIGAWRKKMDVGYGLNSKEGTAWGPDGRYGGFYTKDDIREIVAYAKTRYVTIVPEIEMPGHAIAALAAYPEYSCSGGPYHTDMYKIPTGVFCAGNDATFVFLERVLAEVIALFPGKYVHIGGDEVKKNAWKQCKKCQARIRQEGLKDERELQSYFIRRIEKFVNAQNRTMIGWDEILEGGLAPNAAVMSWRGVEGGVAAANAGHDVVMTPIAHCYFCFVQAETGEPPGYTQRHGEKITVSLDKVYSFEPVAPAIDADKAKHVLGAEGTLWSEYFPNYAHAQYMAYPRACALAEVTWTDPSRKNWDDFRSRLDVHLQRLKAQKVNYRQPQPTKDASDK
jgi:hexosaminidase